MQSKTIFVLILNPRKGKKITIQEAEINKLHKSTEKIFLFSTLSFGKINSSSIELIQLKIPNIIITRTSIVKELNKQSWSHKPKICTYNSAKLTAEWLRDNCQN